MTTAKDIWIAFANEEDAFVRRVNIRRREFLIKQWIENSTQSNLAEEMGFSLAYIKKLFEKHGISVKDRRDRLGVSSKPRV